MVILVGMGVFAIKKKKKKANHAGVKFPGILVSS